MEVEVPAGCNKIDLDNIFGPIWENCLVILNQKILIPNFKLIWERYDLKICADGGANRLFDYFNDDEREFYIPNYIVGDLDSLREEVGDWYRNKGSILIKQETQYATDLTKALDLVEIHYSYNLNDLEINEYDGLIELYKTLNHDKKIQILLIGAIDGRFDHTIQSISTLLKRSLNVPKVLLYFISNTDLVLNIPKGLNFINYSKNDKLYHGSNVGLLPLGGEIILTTNGFKWDVLDWGSSMNSSVSSSNRFVGKNGVLIKNNEPFIMNIELNFEYIS